MKAAILTVLLMITVSNVQPRTATEASIQERIAKGTSERPALATLVETLYATPLRAPAIRW